MDKAPPTKKEMATMDMLARCCRSNSPQICSDIKFDGRGEDGDDDDDA